MKLEFDENAAFVKATKPVDLKRMRSVIGCLKDRLPEGSKAWIDEMRGPVELPPQRKKQGFETAAKKPRPPQPERKRIWSHS